MLAAQKAGEGEGRGPELISSAIIDRGVQEVSALDAHGLQSGCKIYFFCFICLFRFVSFLCSA